MLQSQCTGTLEFLEPFVMYRRLEALPAKCRRRKILDFDQFKKIALKYICIVLWSCFNYEIICTFCKIEKESLEHLLFFCKVTGLYWMDVLSWIGCFSFENMEISLLDVLFTFRCVEDFLWSLTPLHYWQNVSFTDVNYVKLTLLSTFSRQN